jgi:hypothetical protein
MMLDTNHLQAGKTHPLPLPQYARAHGREILEGVGIVITSSQDHSLSSKGYDFFDTLERFQSFEA